MKKIEREPVPDEKGDLYLPDMFCVVKIKALDELEWTVERQNTKIATLEELVNELSNKKDKLLEILTLAVCNFGTSYYGKIYNMAVKTIQKENRDKTWEDIKAEVKQKNDING